MNTKQNEAIHYCTHCGAANKKSAVECSECEKKIITKYRPFYDFLIKHTKDEASGAAVDSVFSLIQKFLLSHVYGIALSVSIVASAVAAVQVSQPHIQKVSVPSATQAVQDNVGEQEEAPDVPAEEFTEDDEYALLYLMSNYDGHADDRRTSERYWEEGHEYVSSPNQLFAQNNIEGYNFGGVHELIENPVDIDFDVAFMDTPPNLTHTRYVDYNTLITSGNFATDIARNLKEAGYRVCECNYVLRIADSDNYDTETNTGTVLKELVYRVVFVEHEGEWYIADDRMI